MKAYNVKVKFKNRYFDVGILPKQSGFDLELSFKGALSGEDYQCLRKYLVEEGYVEAANKFLLNKIDG